MKGLVEFVPMVSAEGESSAASLGGWGFGISRYTPLYELVRVTRLINHPWGLIVPLSVLPAR